MPYRRVAALRQGGRAEAYQRVSTAGSEPDEESIMTFDRAWVLPFLLLPVFFMVWQWRRGGSRIALTLKALMAAAVILALAEPRMDVAESKVATAVLVDTSASVSSDDLRQ